MGLQERANPVRRNSTVYPRTEVPGTVLNEAGETRSYRRLARSVFLLDPRLTGFHLFVSVVVMTPSCTIDRRPRNSKPEKSWRNPHDSRAAPPLTRHYVLEKKFQSFFGEPPIPPAFERCSGRVRISVRKSCNPPTDTKRGRKQANKHPPQQAPEHRAPCFTTACPQTQSISAPPCAPCTSEREHRQTHTRPDRDRRSRRHTVRPVPTCACRASASASRARCAARTGVSRGGASVRPDMSGPAWGPPSRHRPAPAWP